MNKSISAILMLFTSFMVTDVFCAINQQQNNQPDEQMQKAKAVWKYATVCVSIVKGLRPQFENAARVLRKKHPGLRKIIFDGYLLPPYSETSNIGSSSSSRGAQQIQNVEPDATTELSLNWRVWAFFVNDFSTAEDTLISMNDEMSKLDAMLERKISIDSNVLLKIYGQLFNVFTQDRIERLKKTTQDAYILANINLISNFNQAMNTGNGSGSQQGYSPRQLQVLARAEMAAPSTPAASVPSVSSSSSASISQASVPLQKMDTSRLKIQLPPEEDNDDEEDDDDDE